MSAAGSSHSHYSDLIGRMLHIVAACLLVQSLPGCVSIPEHKPLASPSPVFDPMKFFSGRTEGRGDLRKIFSSPVPVIVQSLGIADEDGELVLNQEVREGEKPIRKRSWRIHHIGEDQYGGSLSDASGPVEISVTGNRIHISFTMDGGFPVDQYIFLAADEQSARNIMVVKKLGVSVAVLDEKIVKMAE